MRSSRHEIQFFSPSDGNARKSAIQTPNDQKQQNFNYHRGFSMPPHQMLPCVRPQMNAFAKMSRSRLRILNHNSDILTPSYAISHLIS